MDIQAQPLVSVVTPVYNGEEYLAECIESVLAQSYRNWDYTIVNNCSTDRTLDIAQSYANKDTRIRIHNNQEFVDIIKNHNIAFSLISPESKYCKVVSADDRITANCLDKMVKLAEAHPTIAIVGSLQRRGEEIRWKGLPHDKQVISGREVCRSSLLDNLDVFGDPTSVLYRSDLIRKSKPFFPHSFPHSDTSACFKYLQHFDFGFLHEVLSIERVHEQQESSKVERLGMGQAASMHLLLEYGPIYLTEEEFQRCKSEMLRGYCRWLGGCVLKMEPKAFWQFQSSRFRELGYPIRWRKVIKGTIDEIADEIQNPRVAFHKLLIVLKEKYYDLLEKKS